MSAHASVVAPTASAPSTVNQAALRVLCLSCVYPNPLEPTYGIFVRNRLRHIAAAGLKVIAPVPAIDYSSPNKAWFANRAIPRRENGCGIEVLHPCWLYPPSGGVLTAICLFVRVLATAIVLRRRFRFDIIDAHFGYPEGIAAALLALTLRVPFTLTLRGSETMHARYPGRRAGMRWAIGRAARVIAVSERLRVFALELGARAERTETIPNGVDTGTFHPRSRAATRARYGIASDSRVVLSAGYLIERKGHHRIVRALARMRRAGISAQLVIAGGPGREGHYADELRNTVRDCGMEDAVLFTGRVEPEQLADLMSAADVLCLASNREGCPNVVNEALACGTPVVATDVGGAPDMIPSETFGLIVPERDDDALEKALIHALSKKWDRNAIAAWARGRSWQQVGAECTAALNSAVAPRRVQA